MKASSFFFLSPQMTIWCWFTRFERSSNELTYFNMLSLIIAGEVHLFFKRGALFCFLSTRLGFNYSIYPMISGLFSVFGRVALKNLPNERYLFCCKILDLVVVWEDTASLLRNLSIGGRFPDLEKSLILPLTLSMPFIYAVVLYSSNFPV